MNETSFANVFPCLKSAPEVQVASPRQTKTLSTIGAALRSKLGKQAVAKSASDQDPDPNAVFDQMFLRL